MSTPARRPERPTHAPPSWLLADDPGWAATVAGLVDAIEARHRTAALAASAVQAGRDAGRQALDQAAALGQRFADQAAAIRQAEATHRARVEALRARTAATALTRPRARGALRPGMAAPAFRPAVIL